jgi:hypothetical protein
LIALAILLQWQTAGHWRHHGATATGKDMDSFNMSCKARLQLADLGPKRHGSDAAFQVLPPVDWLVFHGPSVHIHVEPGTADVLEPSDEHGGLTLLCYFIV